MNKRIKITHGEMNLLLVAVEHGFREHERGKTLQDALAGIFDLYQVSGPIPNTDEDRRS